MFRRIAIVALCVLPLLSAAQERSVLAEGRWWRVSTSMAGVYSIGVADIPQLAGVSIDSIGVYGTGGRQLSTANQQLSTADVPPMSAMVVDNNGNGVFDAGDKLLFYGEGAGGWQRDDDLNRWTYQVHSYATTNHCFVGIGVPSTSVKQVVAPMAADTLIDTYTAVAKINNDLYNPLQTGQTWVGEKFTPSLSRRTFTLSLPSVAQSDVLMRMAMASFSTASAQFRVSCGALQFQRTIAPQVVYTSLLESVAGGNSSYSVQMEYVPGESSAEGYLDYIEINASVQATMQGGAQLTMRQPARGKIATMQLRQARQEVLVWDVTDATAVRQMNTSMTGSTMQWTDTLSMARTYVAFLPTAVLAPDSVTAIANQNLHGAPQADYVVVCHPMFRQQAMRLASLHEIADGLSTLVVTDREVFNEYSSGKPDPVALRAFLRHLTDRYTDAPPRWLLLLGKGTFDNRDLLGNHLPTVVTYETAGSWDDDGGSYGSDDPIVSFSTASSRPQMGVGRLPARNVAEAEHMIDKIERYMMRADLQQPMAKGDWRNAVAMLADDADPGHPGDTSFAHSAEETAQNLLRAYPDLNVERLFADAYQQRSGAIGSYYPDLNNALRKRINNGCLLLNYIGHGSTAYIGTERYITLADISAYTNTDRLPLLVTSTCTFGRYDLPTGGCGAEAFLLAQGGAVGVISAARPIPHIHRFNNDLLTMLLGGNETCGEALMKAKQNTNVSASIQLLGDPALRLSRPQNRVVVTHINGRAVDSTVADTATALSTVTVTGEIHNPEGQLIDDFDGRLHVMAYDRKMYTTTLANDNTGTELRFQQQKNVLYKGSHEVKAGRFEYSFIVPRDVPYQYEEGKLSHYAGSPTEDASGQYSNLLFGGLDETAQYGDNRPTVRLFLGDTAFRNGGIVGPTPTLVALLADSVGINAVGSGVGHDITAIIDGNPNAMLVLNDFFESGDNGIVSGTVNYTLDRLEPGTHTLTLKAWNIFNLSGNATICFEVKDTSLTIVENMMCYPNPASTQTSFVCQTNHPEGIASARLSIYNSRGQMVADQDVDVVEGRYVVGPVVWNVSNVPPGIYLGRMMITTTQGDVLQETTKCIVK